MSKLLWQCTYDDCQAPRVGDAKYCHTHLKGFEKMARDVKKAAEKKRYVIPKESAKRKKERPIYNKLAKQQLSEHSECQIRIMGVCIGKASENHHSAKRGKNYLNKEFFMSACAPCHKYVERVMSATERRQKGFLK